MTRQTTASGFPYYVGSDKPAGHVQQQDLADRLEAIAAKYDTGGLVTSGDRKGQPLPAPGRRGRFYRDTGTGQRGALWLDVESDWEPIATIPVGGVLEWPWTTDPPGPATWLELNGQSIAKAAWPEIFALAGIAANTMNLPDRRGRTTLGAGAATDTTSARTVGAIGGVESVTLSIDQIPTHTHGITGTDEDFPPASSGNLAVRMMRRLANWGTNGVNGGPQPNGGGQAHTNMPPFQVTRYFVRGR